jgi:hypothetical protein
VPHANTADTDKDDRFDENGIDETRRAGCHRRLLRPHQSRLRRHAGEQQSTASVGENGYESFMDDVADSSGIMTIDFGFEVLCRPAERRAHAAQSRWQ